VVWFAYNSSKPKLFAKVEVTSKAVRSPMGMILPGIAPQSF